MSCLAEVSQYMVQDVIKMHKEVMLSEACTYLKKKDTDEIVVVDNDNHPIGIVTDEDILKRIGESYVKPERTSLEDIMTFPVIGIKQEQNLLESLKIMNMNKIRKLVVLTDDNTVTGLLYKSTITNLVSQSIARRPKQSSLWGVIWNLGIIMQFAGALMLIPGILQLCKEIQSLLQGYF